MQVFSKCALWGLVLFVCAACVREGDFDMDKFSGIGIDYDIAMPLTETRLTMENLIDLQGGVFVPDEEGLLHIVYASEPSVFPLVGEMGLASSVPLRMESGTHPYFFRDTLLEFLLTDSVPFPLSGYPEGFSIERLHIESLDLQIDLSNLFAGVLEMECVFPNLFDNAGNPVSVRGSVVAGGSEKITFRIQDAEYIPVSPDPCLVTEAGFSVRLSENPSDSVCHYGSFSLEGIFSDMEVGRLDGFLGKMSYDLSGDLSVAGLGLDRMSDIDFKHASVTAELKVSGLSAPLRVESSALNVFFANSEEEMPLFPDGYAPAYPEIGSDPMEKTEYREIDVSPLIGERPKRMQYAIRGKVNPEADRTSLQALEEGASLSLGLTCDLPVWFSADRYCMVDTIDIFGDQIGEDKRIDYFQLKSIVKNAFPLDMDVKIRFLDRNYRELFVLCEDRRVGAAPVGSDMHVVDPVVMRFDDPLSSEQADVMGKAAYAEISSRISSIGKGNVKIFAPSDKEGFLDVKVGFRAKFTQTVQF